MSIRSIERRSMILGLGALLSPFAAQAASRIKKDPVPPPIRRIALLGPSEPKYTLIEHHPWKGPILHTESFSAALAARNVRIGDEIRAEIKAMLEREGFEVVEVTVKRNEKLLIPFVDTDIQLDVEVDAVLDAVLPIAAYVGSVDEFGPLMWLHVQLFRTWIYAKKRIFRDEMGYELGLTLLYKVPIDEDRFVFESAAEVLTSMDVVAESFRAPIPKFLARIRESFEDEGLLKAQPSTAPAPG
jgi:hypothetical protein